MEKPIRPRATTKAKIMKVIVTESLVGHGTNKDPCRNVIRYWSLDGRLLAEYDSLITANDPFLQVERPPFFAPDENSSLDPLYL